MFEFTFGDVGSGKSLVQAARVRFLCERSLAIERKKKKSKKWQKVVTPREVWCNFHLSDEMNLKYPHILKVWHDPLDMIFKDSKRTEIRTDFDCVWDELAVELPSDRWKDTHPEIRRFFAQHRKRGIEIYGNTQDYMMLDVNARRMVTRVFKCHKLFGSRDPSASKPPIENLWGLILVWRIDKECIRADDKDIRHADILPYFQVISKKSVSIYNTREDIKKAPMPAWQHALRPPCVECGYSGSPAYGHV